MTVATEHAVPPSATDPHAPPATAPSPISSHFAYWTLVASHLIVDLYPIFTFALAASIQANLSLTEAEIATVLAVGPVVSGASQPLFAWLGDKFNTRLFAPLGLAVGAVAMSLLGFAETFWQIIALQVIGLTGTGVYHPIASAVAGRLGADAMRGRRFARSPRGFGLAVFFTAGMMGGFFGPLIVSRINLGLGIEWIAVMMAPGLLCALFLWLAVRNVQHRTLRPPAPTVCDDAAWQQEASHARRWAAVGLLFCSNSMRFCANIGLYYMYKQLAQARYADADIASSNASNLIAATTLGMAVLGMTAGALVRPGREKWPTALSGFIIAPVAFFLPQTDGILILFLAFLTSAGHFSVIPLSIAAAQRMLPHATGSVGSILMGCGWVVSAGAPYACGYVVEDLGHGIQGGFALIAIFLALAGVCGLLLPSDLLRESAQNDN